MVEMHVGLTTLRMDPNEKDTGPIYISTNHRECVASTSLLNLGPFTSVFIFCLQNCNFIFNLLLFSNNCIGNGETKKLFLQYPVQIFENQK